MNLHDMPARCFQGVGAATLATCDKNLIPNTTILSQVFRVDDGHVALSCQFFNKTKKNVLESPYGCISLLDPVTFEAYRLDVRYDHDEKTGPLFDSMAVRVDAIASHTGMTGVFKLLSADVYEVLAVERIAGFLSPGPALPPEEELSELKGELRNLQLVSQRACRARDLESLLSTVLEALEDAFGFTYSMILLPDETGSRLFTIASRGYGDNGIGAEIGMGEGLIGTVARERCILRVAGVGAELRYGRAIRTSVHRAGGARSLRPEIPLPGLVDAQSQIALPLVSGDRLVGVIAVESVSPGAFEEWHEAYLDVIANQVAVAIEHMTLRDAEPTPPEAAPAASPPAPVPAAIAATPAAGAPAKRRFRFYRNDDCVFADDEYLVRNVPGRILWKMLRAYQTTGRTEFTNRELRLDPFLGLPAIRDNLESRLVLLRKRLEQKSPDIRIVPTARGQFHLQIGCTFDLEELDGA